MTVKNTENSIMSDITGSAHLCLFYQNKTDLIDILVPYFNTGLENNEFCMWIVSAPNIGKEGETAMRKAIPDFDKHLRKCQIEILFYDELFIENNCFNTQRMFNIWISKLNQALAKGYNGMRVIMNPAWYAGKGWKNIIDYEEEVNKMTAEHKVIAICAYPQDKFKASEIVEVVSRNQSILIKQEDKWKYIKNDRYKQTETEIQQNLDNQIILNKLLHLSQTNIPLSRFLEHTIDIILSVPWFSFNPRGCIFLIEDNNPEVLVMKAEKNCLAPVIKKCNQVPLGKCLCGRAALTRKMQFANCIDKRHDIMYKGIIPHGHYCVPIIYDNEVLGVLNLYVKNGHLRNQKEENFLQTIADTMSGVIVRKQGDERLKNTLTQLREAMNGTIHALESAVKLKDSYTAGHQRRVSSLACSIAKEMCLPEKQIDGIRIAGNVHDLGKICIPSDILNRFGRITDMEFNIIKTHAKTGYDILIKVDFPWPIAQIVFQHHERFNGSGYPNGLKSEEILLEAKILAVADVVEAMASQRPYREALGIDKALDEISNNKGILYDPMVTDACIKLFAEKEFKLE